MGTNFYLKRKLSKQEKDIAKELIDNDKYDIKLNHRFVDEISSLNESIEQMKEYLINNEKYKNQT